MTHNVTCNRCGDEFTARRSDARYCSSRCRTAAHRGETVEQWEARQRTQWAREIAGFRTEYLMANVRMGSLMDKPKFAAWAKGERGQEYRVLLECERDRLSALLDVWPEPSQPKGSETATETDGPTERITLP